MREVHVRTFKPSGLRAFSELLDQLKAFPGQAKWQGGTRAYEKSQLLLFEDEYSYSIQEERTIEPDKEFETRFEFGQYLFDVFGRKALERDTEQLAWLTLLYFDQVCEKKKGSDILKVLSKYRYIPEVNNNRRFYRHLVLTPLLLWQRLGVDSLFLLSNPLYESSDAVEQLVSRQDFISNPNAIAVAQELYYDGPRNRIRSGAFSNSKAGNAKRLVRDLIPQLSVNYDMYVMSKDQIIELLPDEFEGWSS